eukprot:TRINITY_DN7556_c0_g1_i1.p1 TRINITY_DN7556_c0_g1~~TRINITY_DN7556_c0_g1_i1.p1  ORF type:complete len:891 (+),score=161.21 TRINITY_DN7556_c0_g1_i1:126-2798(+)
MMAGIATFVPSQPQSSDDWDCLVDVTCCVIRAGHSDKSFDSQPISDKDGPPSIIAPAQTVEVWYGLAYGVLRIDKRPLDVNARLNSDTTAPPATRSNTASPSKPLPSPRAVHSCPGTPLRPKRSLWQRLWRNHDDTMSHGHEDDDVETVVDLTKTDNQPSCLLHHEDDVWMGTSNGLIKVIDAKTRKVKDNLSCHNAAVTTMIIDDTDDRRVWSLSHRNHLVCWNTSTRCPLINLSLKSALSASQPVSSMLACNDQLWLAFNGDLVAVAKDRPNRIAHRLTLRESQSSAKAGNNNTHDDHGGTISTATSTGHSGDINLNELATVKLAMKLAEGMVRVIMAAAMQMVRASLNPDQDDNEISSQTQVPSNTTACLDHYVDNICLGVADEIWTCSKRHSSLQVIDLRQRLRLVTWVVEESGLLHLLAAGTALWAAAASGALYAWHMKSKDPLLRLTLHQSAISCLALSPCQDYLLTASGDPHPQLLVHSVWTLLERNDNHDVISQRIMPTDTDVQGPPAEPEAVVRRARLDESAPPPRSRLAAEYDDYGFRRAPVKDSWEPPMSPVALHCHLEAVDLSRLEHEDKWREAIATINANPEPELPQTLDQRRLFRYGIPVQHRKEAWLHLIEARIGELRRFKEREDNYYHSILEYKRNTPNPYAMAIKLDLLRTFPSNLYFQSFDAPCVLRLQRVLTAFAWHHPNIGYCQGLNLLAAFLLLYLDEQDAFWGLLTLVENVMEWEYYRFPMLGSHIDLRIFSDLVDVQLPQLSQHFKDMQFDLKATSFSWFFTAFVGTLPTECVMRIWDAFLAEGRVVLFRYGLAVLRCHADKLLAIDDLLALHTYMRTDLQHYSDVNRLTELAFNIPNMNVDTFIQSRQIQYRKQCTQDLAADNLSD